MARTSHSGGRHNPRMEYNSTDLVIAPEDRRVQLSRKNWSRLSVYSKTTSLASFTQQGPPNPIIQSALTFCTAITVHCNCTVLLLTAA